MQQGRRPGAVFQIADRALLAEELRRAIYAETAGERRPIGNLRAAADRIGISAATLSRLYNKKMGSLSESILDAIGSLIPERRRSIVWRALMSPDAQELLHAAGDAYQAEIQAIYRHRTGKRWVGTEKGVRRTDDLVTGKPGTDSLRPRAQEAAFLQQLAEHLFPDLYRKFGEAVASSENSVMRMELAKARVIAPLLEAREAGLIERDWRELEGSDHSWREFRAFVKAGLERERILLNRAPNVQRAQDIASRSADFTEPNYIGLSLTHFKFKLRR